VSWLYSDALKRENIKTALEAELNYQALALSLTAVLNKALGGQGDIPEKLGVMDALENKNPERKKTLTHYREDAPDILSIL
jgi:hypothetical protein